MKDKFVNNLVVENRVMAKGKFSSDFQQWVRDNWHESPISEILSVDMTDFNSYAATDEFVLEVSDTSIPVSTYVSEIFTKVTEEIESYSYGYSGCKILSIELLNMYDINTIGNYPKNSNTAIKITLDVTNPQDWTAGKLTIYGKMTSIPTF